MKEFSLPPMETFTSCGVKHPLVLLIREAVRLLSLRVAALLVFERCSDGIGLKRANSILGERRRCALGS